MVQGSIATGQDGNQDLESILRAKAQKPKAWHSCELGSLHEF